MEQRVDPGGAVPDSKPEPCDLYSAAPASTPFGDKHPGPRRIGVAAVGRHVATSLSRTTQAPRRGVRAIRSAADLDRGLTKDGWWTEEHQRPMLISEYGTDKCKYMATLEGEPAVDFLNFWGGLCMLGLAHEPRD